MSGNPRSRDFDRWDDGSSASDRRGPGPSGGPEDSQNATYDFQRYGANFHARPRSYGSPHWNDPYSETGTYRPPNAPWEKADSSKSSSQRGAFHQGAYSGDNNTQYSYSEYRAEYQTEYSDQSDSSGSYTSPGSRPTPSFIEKTQRSRTLAGILGILFGAFGVHNFYLGKYAMGVVQLLVTVLSGGSLAIFVGVWGIVEGIMYLTNDAEKWNVDGWGRPLS